jgi:hypothetical protein
MSKLACNGDSDPGSRTCDEVSVWRAGKSTAPCRQRRLLPVAELRDIGVIASDIGEESLIDVSGVDCCKSGCSGNRADGRDKAELTGSEPWSDADPVCGSLFLSAGSEIGGVLT